MAAPRRSFEGRPPALRANRVAIKSTAANIAPATVWPATMQTAAAAAPEISKSGRTLLEKKWDPAEIERQVGNGMPATNFARCELRPAAQDRFPGRRRADNGTGKESFGVACRIKLAQRQDSLFRRVLKVRLLDHFPGRIARSPIVLDDVIKQPHCQIVTGDSDYVVKIFHGLISFTEIGPPEPRSLISELSRKRLRAGRQPPKTHCCAGTGALRGARVRRTNCAAVSRRDA
jgi:hypothetical protein